MRYKDMICKNDVPYMVEVGETMRYVERQVRCGNTDPNGERCICDECRSNPAIMESIRNHQANVKADNEWLRSAGWGEM
jgi:hypothetical protein